MAENVTNELLFEHMKQIQVTLAQHGQQFERIGHELKAIKLHIQGLVQSDLNRDGDIADLQVRMARLERRLELHD